MLNIDSISAGLCITEI